MTVIEAKRRIKWTFSRNESHWPTTAENFILRMYIRARSKQLNAIKDNCVAQSTNTQNQLTSKTFISEPRKIIPCCFVFRFYYCCVDWVCVCAYVFTYKAHMLSAPHTIKLSLYTAHTDRMRRNVCLWSLACLTQ